MWCGRRHKDEFFAKHGVKLGFMSPFIKASAEALQEIPDSWRHFDTDVHRACVTHTQEQMEPRVEIGPRVEAGPLGKVGPP